MALVAAESVIPQIALEILQIAMIMTLHQLALQEEQAGFTWSKQLVKMCALLEHTVLTGDLVTCTQMPNVQRVGLLRSIQSSGKDSELLLHVL